MDMLQDGKHIDKAGIVKLRKAGRYLLAEFQEGLVRGKGKLTMGFRPVRPAFARLFVPMSACLGPM